MAKGEQTKRSAAISTMILARVMAGETVAAAVDAVLGAGTHARVAGDLYEALRAATR